MWCGVLCGVALIVLCGVALIVLCGMALIVLWGVALTVGCGVALIVWCGVAQQSEALVEYYKQLCIEHPGLVLLEDPMAKEDVNGYSLCAAG